MQRLLRPTPEQHRRYGELLRDLRVRLARITTQVLSGRVPAAVLDAALRVERDLATLCLRLADAADASGADGAAGCYTVDPPVVARRVPPPAGRMTVAEHWAVGSQLHRLRDDVLALFGELAERHPKASPVGRAVRRPERSLDHLRCKLDELFCVQHRSAFDTHAYYPGSRRDAGAIRPEPQTLSPSSPLTQETP